MHWEYCPLKFDSLDLENYSPRLFKPSWSVILQDKWEQDCLPTTHEKFQFFRFFIAQHTKNLCQVIGWFCKGEMGPLQNHSFRIFALILPRYPFPPQYYCDSLICLFKNYCVLLFSQDPLKYRMVMKLKRIFSPTDWFSRMTFLLP